MKWCKLELFGVDLIMVGCSRTAQLIMTLLTVGAGFHVGLLAEIIFLKFLR